MRDITDLLCLIQYCIHTDSLRPPWYTDVALVVSVFALLCKFTGPDSRRPLMAGTCFRPSHLFTLSPALRPSISIALRNAFTHVLRMRQRAEHTDARQFSLMGTVGHRTELLLGHPTTPPPIKSVGLQTASSRPFPTVDPHQRGEPIPAHRL